MISHYFDEMAELALEQQNLAIFDQKREKDLINNRLKILDEIDIKKPDVVINQYTIFDVDATGKVKNIIQQAAKPKEVEKAEEGFEINRDARINSEFVFDNILPPLLIALMQFSSALLTEVMNLFLLTG